MCNLVGQEASGSTWMDKGAVMRPAGRQVRGKEHVVRRADASSIFILPPLPAVCKGAKTTVQ
eukprot:5880174-Alexandrium_andersonii.AAC.1